MSTAFCPPRRTTSEGIPSFLDSDTPPLVAATMWRASVRLAASAAAGRQRPLAALLRLAEQTDYRQAADVFEQEFLDCRSAAVNASSSSSALLRYARRPSEARDIVFVMMRVYTALGKMEKLRMLMSVAVSDLACLELLNASVFDSFLEAMLKRKSSVIREEVEFILSLMEQHHVPKSAQTYLYLVELHLRCDMDPSGVWDELTNLCDDPYSDSKHGSSGKPDEPGEADRLQDVSVLGATARAMLFRVLPATTDSRLRLSIVRWMLATDRLEQARLVEVVVDWLQDPDVSPADALWLLFELEQRCVLERVALSSSIQKQHLAALLMRCAKAADHVVATKVLSFMERHMMPKSADHLALCVWCYAAAGEVEKALKVVEGMSRRGFLDGVDPFKPFSVSLLSFVMERHFLMALSDALHNAALVESAVRFLTHRRDSGQAVSLTSLDIVLLATSRLGDESKAAEFLESYPSFGHQPRTLSYNCLFLSSAATRSTGFHRKHFAQMIQSRVAPSAHTFRLLIRQALQCNDVDEAVRYLESVPSHGSLRIEIEMLLPILEKAAHVGDVHTVNQISKFSLDCDLGVDAAVLQNVMQRLADHGCDVATLKSHLSLHEALRNRSKYARKRTHNSVAL